MVSEFDDTPWPALSPKTLTVAHPVASDGVITSLKTTTYEINASDAQNELVVADYNESRFYKSSEAAVLSTKKPILNKVQWNLTVPTIHEYSQGNWRVLLSTLLGILGLSPLWIDLLEYQTAKPPSLLFPLYLNLSHGSGRRGWAWSGRPPALELAVPSDGLEPVPPPNVLDGVAALPCRWQRTTLRPLMSSLALLVLAFAGPDERRKLPPQARWALPPELQIWKAGRGG
uniref:Uncharacterized protein n=1 Tax=Leersia perrieri TaxID=77586 RepID=A0A0D9V075_9ORYZ